MVIAPAGGGWTMSMEGSGVRSSEDAYDTWSRAMARSWWADRGRETRRAGFPLTKGGGFCVIYAKLNRHL